MSQCTRYYDRVPMHNSTLRLTALGQALIQHDRRAQPWPDFAALAAMFARADVCFTGLETAVRSPEAEAPTRQGVFLHAADPGVLDCLKDLSISLLATANNHAFDLGTGGISRGINEPDTRGLTHPATRARPQRDAPPAHPRPPPPPGAPARGG